MNNKHFIYKKKQPENILYGILDLLSWNGYYNRATTPQINLNLDYVHIKDWCVKNMKD
jgi:hypothetical protein